MPFAASFALAVSLALGGSQAGPVQASTAPMPAAQSVEDYVRGYFKEEPLLAEIAKCESHFKQFDKDGTVHRGVVNNQDVGVMQINEHYHLEVSQKLGIDIYSLQGNLAYGKYLYDKEGVQPWISSGPCWKKSQAYKDLQSLALK